MAQDGSTPDGPDRAPRSPWARSAFPRSPWQPDGAGSIEPPNDGPSVMGGPAGPAGPAELGNVIDLAPPDDGGFIDLKDPDRSSAVEVGPDHGVRPEASRMSVRLDAFAATLFSAVHGSRYPSRRPRTRPATDRPRTAIIDLGERHGGVPTDGARLGPAPWRSLEWRAHLRPFALVIVVVAALLVGGSVAPPPSRLARLANITVPLGASLAVEGARAWVLGSRDGVGESLAAYNVAGGAREWFTELPIRQSDDVGMTVADGVIIVAGGRLGNRGAHTIVVDENTGRRLWSSAQDLMSPRRGSDTLLVSDGPPTEVMARDKRTGALRWDLSLPPGCTVKLAVPAAAEAPSALLELCLRQGQLSRINLNTGKPEVTRSVVLNPEQDVDITWFTVDDVVVIEDAGVKPPVFDTYNLNDLKPIWRSRGATENAGSYACGVEICESAGGSTVILDTHSGAVIPTTGHEAELLPILQPFIPKSAVGTLLLPAPGATLPVVSKTTYVADFAGDDAVVQVPLFRPGRTWIVTLSPEGVRDAVQLLDGPAADVCRPIGSYLGCMTAKQTLTFWPLPKVE
jgi:PQQ-like domain